MPETSPPVDLKNRWLAAALAFALPGLGHAYQGRTFKAVVFAVSILGLFHWGQALAGWRAVYIDDDPDLRRYGQPQKLVRQMIRGYGAQVFNGAVAWPAFVQLSRHAGPENREDVLTGPIDAVAVGQLQYGDGGELRSAGSFAGRLALEVDDRGRVTGGRFEGTDGEERPVTLAVTGLAKAAPPIEADPWRDLWVTVETDGLDLPDIDLSESDGAMLVAEVRRPLLDWYQVPPDQRQKDALHHEFGTGLEIALVFTWVSGFLNVLVIWDAFDGPAYKDSEGRPVDAPPGEEAKRKRRDDTDADEGADA